MIAIPDVILANRASVLLYSFCKQYGGVYVLPANICPIVPITLKYAGVRFIFVDIDNETLCVDKEACFRLFEQKKANRLIYVHTYGLESNSIDFFTSLKESFNDLLIVDDKCLCMPMFFSHPIIADMELYSTGISKQVDLGYGAYAYIKNNLNTCYDLNYNGYDIDKYYKDHFSGKEKIIVVPNGWLNTICDINMEQYLFDIEQYKSRIINHKKHINNIYRTLLPKDIIYNDEYNNWRFNIRVSNKNKVLSELFNNGLFASSHYRPSSTLFEDSHYKNSERLYNSIINLFNDFHITQSMAEKTCSIINKSL